MGTENKKKPDFFEDDIFDPVKAAIGPGLSKDDSVSADENNKPRHGSKNEPAKKKAGYYLSAELLDRFNSKFYELKLSGAMIENKSAMVEAALSFALDDMDLGRKSLILKKISSNGR